MIKVDSLTKRYGAATVVDNLSFEVRAGRVTGFLGPNGAGKTTTLRMILGLIGANSGTATISGRSYADLEHPSGQVGAVLEDASFHPGRSARNHLRILATAGGHPLNRVDKVLAEVGLTKAAKQRVKGFSLGMRQRLAIAAALLGDPEVLILDEPSNGLDPPGIRWMRDLIRTQADHGRAVLVSSHMLSEVALSVDDLVVIAHGVLRASGSLAEVLGANGELVTRVRSDDGQRLAALLSREGITVESGAPGLLLAHGTTPTLVGALAADNHVALTELGAVTPSLEDAFFELTKDAA